MSNTTDIIVKCKNCLNTQKYTYWKSVHISLDNEKRNSLLNNLFANFICVKCGWSTFIKRNFLYEDTKNHYLFWLINPNENGEILIPVETDKIYSVYDDNYIFRIVTTYEELIEKINIYDDGFYDLLIEIIKIFLSVKGRIKLSEPFYYIGCNENDKTIIFNLPSNEFQNKIEYPIEGNVNKLNNFINDHQEFKELVFSKFKYLHRGMVLEFMQKIGVFK